MCHFLDQVNQFMSDPFMMWITPTTQYNYQYTVGTAKGAVDAFKQVLLYFHVHRVVDIGQDHYLCIGYCYVNMPYDFQALVIPCHCDTLT